MKLHIILSTICLSLALLNVHAEETEAAAEEAAEIGMPYIIHSSQVNIRRGCG